MAEIIMVRHAQSEMNYRLAADLNGEGGHFDEEYRARHNSRCLLTELGVEQAKMVGEMLRQQLKLFESGVSDFIVSPFARTLQTASLLGYVDAQWTIEAEVRLRDWGIYDKIPISERQFYWRQYEQQERNAMWAPPNGESLLQVVERLNTWVRGYFPSFPDASGAEGKTMLVVTHDEIIQAMHWVMRPWLHFSDKTVAVRPPNAGVVRFSNSDAEGGFGGVFKRAEHYMLDEEKSKLILTRTDEFNPNQTFTSEQLMEIAQQYNQAPLLKDF